MIRSSQDVETSYVSLTGADRRMGQGNAARAHSGMLVSL